MNGAQDMGGVHGFGPVLAGTERAGLHAEWEKRAFALTLAMAMPGQWNIDMSRFARENRDPAEYLSLSYYQIWFAGLETMLKERDLVRDDEIVAGHALHAGKARAARVIARRCAQGSASRRTDRAQYEQQGAFKAGERVRAKTINPPTHTRLPRYVRGHAGLVERVIGCHVFPDSNAMAPARTRNGSIPCALTPATCGARPRPDVGVSVDAWEPYLEPA